MKNKTLLLVFLLLVSFTTEATIRTVSNNAASPGQYSNLATAITASALGDTIYLQGSTVSYGDITIQRKITIIGAGYSPDSTDYNLSSKVGNIIFDSVASIGYTIRGCKLIGLDVLYDFDYASGDVNNINEITFERCLIEGTYAYMGGNNWSFLNCIFNEVDLYFENHSNIQFYNCFFVTTQLLYSSQPSVNFYNSIFINYTNTDFFYSFSYAGIYNSIFWNNSVANCTSCLYKKCISVDEAAQVILPDSVNISNSTGDMFVSTMPATSSTIPYTDLKKYNWHLKATSAGHNYGTDGKDIGIYGGSMPYVNLSGMYPQIPVVKSFIIKNPVAQKNGKLSISVKAEKKQ